MNKSIIAFVFFAFTFAFHGNAQEASFSQNEIKTNVFNDLFGLGTLTYERLLNESSGVGITLSSPFAEPHLVVSPYYRLYFGKKAAAGFFAEGGALFTSGFEDGENTLITGVGLMVGAKLLSKRGVVFEVAGGLGRILNDFDGADDDLDDIGLGTLIYPRFALTVGKRF